MKRTLHILIFFLLSLTGYAQCPPLKLYDINFSEASEKQEWVNCIDDESSPDNYQLKISSPERITNYTIDFGDGSPVAEGAVLESNSIVTHTYGIGEFKVKVTGEVDGCMTSASGTVINDRKPGAAALPPTNYTSGCTPHELRFINQSTNISPHTEFVWKWGDGKTLVQGSEALRDTVSHVYERAGCNQRVRLEARGLCATSYSIYGPFDMWDIDKAKIEASEDKVCNNTVVTFKDKTEYNCNNKQSRYIRWDTRELGGSLTGWIPAIPENKEIDVPVTGEAGQSYKVYLYDSSYCGVSKASYTMHIEEAPTAVIKADAASVCEGSSVFVENKSYGGANVFHWDFGDGSGWKTEEMDSYDHTFTNPGTYKVRLFINVKESPSCNDTTTLSVDVLPSPKADFTLPEEGSCAPYIASVENNSKNATQAKWFVDDSFVSAEKDPDPFVLSGHGLHEVKLEVVNDIGCPSSVSRVFNAVPDLKPDFEAEGFCAGSATKFNNTTDLSLSDSGYVLRKQVLGSDVQKEELLTVFESYNNPEEEFSSDISGYILPPETGDYTFWIAGDDNSELWLSTDDSKNNLVKIAFTAGTTGRQNWEVGMTQESSAIRLKAGQRYYIEARSVKRGNYADYLGVGWKLPDGTLQRPISGDYLQASVPENNSFSWNWDFGDGKGSASKDPKHTFDKEGSYNVKLTASNGYCQFSDSMEVEINKGADASFVVDSTSGCSPKNFYFRNTSKVGSQFIVKYNDGSENDTIGPGAVFNKRFASTAEQKNLKVTLLAKTDLGCHDTYSEKYSTDEKDVNFSLDKTSGCTPFTAEIENKSENGGVYTWIFPGKDTVTTGASSFSRDITVGDRAVYSDSIVLVADYGDCSMRVSKDINIFPQPDFGIKKEMKSCYPATVKLSSTGGVAFHEWEFGDGFVSNEENPEHQYVFSSVSDTTLRVNLTGVSLFGCIDTASIEIPIYKSPEADLSLRDKGSSFCHPFETALINNSANGSDSRWLINGSPVKEKTDTLYRSFSSDDGLSRTHIVQLVVENESGCRDTASRKFTVHPIPVASFVPSDSVGCSPLSLSFYNTSRGASEFKWTMNGISNHSQDLSYIFKNNGVNDTVYSVKLTAKNIQGCTDSIEKDITVYGSPDPDILTSDVSNLSSGDMITAKAVVKGSYDNLSWDLSDGRSFAGKEEIIFPVEYSGTNIIRLTATGNGCSRTVEKDIEVAYEPPMAIAEGSGEGCGKMTINFHNNSVNAKSFKWDFGDGEVLEASSKSSVAHTFYNTSAEARFFTIRLIAYGDGGSDTIVLKESVRLLPAPAISFSVDPPQVAYPGDVWFINQTRNATSYLWDFGDGNTSIKKAPVHAYAEKGVYDVKLIATNKLGCSDTLVIDEAVTVTDGAYLKMPNTFTPSGDPSGPASDGLNDVFKPGYSEGVEKYHLQIFNKWGVLIFESFDVEEGWNGYHQGKRCMEGVYVYAVKAHFSDGSYKEITGDVTLLDIQ